MPPDEQLILRPGMKPIRARKIQWFREPQFTSRRMPPPKIPQLTVEIPMADGRTGPSVGGDYETASQLTGVQRNGVLG